MEHKKEQALPDFISMINRSWTFAKMTDDEKERLYESFKSDQLAKALKGSYVHRWMILHTMYAAFLSGLGYSYRNGWNDWRGEKGNQYPHF